MWTVDSCVWTLDPCKSWFICIHNSFDSCELPIPVSTWFIWNLVSCELDSWTLDSWEHMIQMNSRHTWTLCSCKLDSEFCYSFAVAMETELWEVNHFWWFIICLFFAVYLNCFTNTRLLSLSQPHSTGLWCPFIRHPSPLNLLFKSWLDSKECRNEFDEQVDLLKHFILNLIEKRIESSLSLNTQWIINDIDQDFCYETATWLRVVMLGTHSEMSAFLSSNRDVSLCGLTLTRMWITPD